MWASAPAMQNKDGAKRGVVPQGHLFRCAPRQDAVPYAQCADAPACPFVGGDAHIAPPESMHILRRGTWIPPYRAHVSAPCQKVRTDFFDKLKKHLRVLLFLFA